MLFIPLVVQDYLVPVLVVEAQTIPVENNALIATQNSSSTEDDPISTSSLIYSLWAKVNGNKMIKIFTCESGMRQFDNKGKPILSPTHDIGISQINIPTWQDKADELGFDIASTTGNIYMAHYIWSQSGFRAWTCSKLIGIL